MVTLATRKPPMVTLATRQPPHGHLGDQAATQVHLDDSFTKSIAVRDQVTSIMNCHHGIYSGQTRIRNSVLQKLEPTWCGISDYENSYPKMNGDRNGNAFMRRKRPTLAPFIAELKNTRSIEEINLIGERHGHFPVYSTISKTSYPTLGRRC